MRTAALICFASILLCAAMFTGNAHQGTVQQKEGIYIYHYSTPADSTEYLGTYKITFISADKPNLCLDKLLRNCKEKFPTCQAIIIADDMYSADAIKFKTK